jgi:glucosylceramidase
LSILFDSLDSIGGPNHLGNLCDSPLLAVPHRSIDAEKGFPAQLGFEHAGHPFGTVHGDFKTREELNAEGSPAKYLDLGIVIQPMYYYVGHITRFVRPGSRAVHGLVDASTGDPEVRTFRPKGQVVAGGGMNDLAREGIEVTLWPCEGSTRQEWLLNGENQLQVFGHDWLGKPTTSCLAMRPDKDFDGLLLTTCNVTENKAGSYEVLPVEGKESKVHIVLSDGKKSCLVVQSLRNNGGAFGARGGAQVNLGSCDHPWAEWGLDSSTGEITSSAFVDLGEVCLTTGWPFLQVGAFDTSATAATGAVIVTNEAGEHANYVLKDRDETILAASIPPRSIQTINFEHVW